MIFKRATFFAVLSTAAGKQAGGDSEWKDRASTVSLSAGVVESLQLHL